MFLVNPLVVAVEIIERGKHTHFFVRNTNEDSWNPGRSSYEPLYYSLRHPVLVYQFTRIYTIFLHYICR